MLLKVTIFVGIIFLSLSASQLRTATLMSLPKNTEDAAILDPASMVEKQVSPFKIKALINDSKPAGHSIRTAASCAASSNLFQYSKLNEKELADMYFLRMDPEKYKELKNIPEVFNEMLPMYYNDFLEFSYAECEDPDSYKGQVFSIEEAFDVGEYNLKEKKFLLTRSSKYPFTLVMKPKHYILENVELKALNESKAELKMDLKSAREFLAKYKRKDGSSIPITATYYFKIYNADIVNMEEFVSSVKNGTVTKLVVNEAIVVLAILYRISDDNREIDYSRVELLNDDKPVIGWQYFE